MSRFNISDLLVALFECTVGDDENPAANKMYKIAYETLSGRDLIEPIRCEDCEYSRPLDRTHWEEDRCSDECLWCIANAKGVLPSEFCSDAYEKVETQ